MRKLLLVMALALASTGVTVVAVGAATDENGGRQASGERGAAGAEGGVESLTFCDGGAQERELNNVQDAMASKAEGAASVLASSEMPVIVPAGDIDTIKITLTGEAFMTGAGPGDRIEVQARSNGAAMEPTPDNIGFQTGSHRDSNSAVWCGYFGPGTHAFDIFWNVWDYGANNTVIGRLDDYVVTLEIMD